MLNGPEGGMKILLWAEHPFKQYLNVHAVQAKEETAGAEHCVHSCISAGDEIIVRVRTAV